MGMRRSILGWMMARQRASNSVRHGCFAARMIGTPSARRTLCGGEMSSETGNPTASIATKMRYVEVAMAPAPALVTLRKVRRPQQSDV